jgi:hypothetical protein
MHIEYVSDDGVSFLDNPTSCVVGQQTCWRRIIFLWVYAQKVITVVLDVSIILTDPFLFYEMYSSINKIYFYMVLHKLSPSCWKSNDKAVP